ncbi:MULTISPECIES: tRNA preQ1(34) S-adenosylmethionine ribosyltransferase-isomerase QueA [Nostocales]|uniref:S-adenosylmethionine:tRNA ribosyltransferase-isomerase n=3 Tax=Nostocales TaxID=1161 RepID=A0A0C1NJV2_9CYAN|nr:tRNA preQ1(34) S-adenosylmethionine ribosyltransferase-isomerase QueA [Tolypothrix bouteillei]KAF3887953.1 tRNA preQ1(34) S-adenosylmethionine ribosyltransferase-isomerase QueA [Tolypothrix bouteillei VB521301]
MQEPSTRNNYDAAFNANKEDTELDTCLAGYDYELPQELIAQNPVVPRDRSRLLVVDPKTGLEAAPQHHIFCDLPELLQSGDLLIMNNTRVIPARLYGYKQTGAEIEVLLLEERQHNCWLTLVKPGKRFKPGTKIVFEPRIKSGDKGWEIGNNKDFSQVPRQIAATVVDKDETTGGRLLQFDLPEGTSLVQLLDVFGEVPLPPYITASEAKSEQYQTVYAQHPGAVAAPTAGLHFTPELLDRLQQRGIEQAFVTLHVGVGTFRPVEVEDIKTHKMHEEWIEVPSATVEKIRMTQASGGRIIAVGTTVVRALEGAASQGELKPFCGKTDMFIYPGYQWRVVEGLITNFHLPRSSLLMLVSALIGRQKLLSVYQEAIASGYRFYSFGDAMLILPQMVSG